MPFQINVRPITMTVSLLESQLRPGSNELVSWWLVATGFVKDGVTLNESDVNIGVPLE